MKAAKAPKAPKRPGTAYTMFVKEKYSSVSDTMPAGERSVALVRTGLLQHAYSNTETVPPTAIKDSSGPHPNRNKPSPSVGTAANCPLSCMHVASLHSRFRTPSGTPADVRSGHIRSCRDESPFAQPQILACS